MKFMMFFRKKNFPCSKQMDAMDCGPACLQSIAKYYGKSYDMNELRKLTFVTREGVSLLGIASAAEKIGFRTRGVKVKLSVLIEQANLPCILYWKQEHFIVLYKIKRNKDGYCFYVADPAVGKICLARKDIEQGWLLHPDKDENLGFCLLLEPTPNFYELIPNTNNRLRISFILKYLKPYRKYIIQLLLAFVIGGLLQLIFPFLTRAIVDKGINLKDLEFIYMVLIGQLFFSLSSSLVEFIRSFLLLHISSRINISILSDFLAKLLNLPIRFFDTKFTGDLLQRIKDHDKIESFLISGTLSMLFSFITIFVFSIILCIYSSLIFFIFITGSIIYIIWIMFFLKRRKEIDYKKFIIASRNQSSIYQLINGIHDIKLNNCEAEKRWEWEGIQVKSFKISLKGIKLEQIQSIGATLINELKNVFITFISATLVLKGEISLGTMMAIQYINGQLNLPVGNVIEFIHSLQDAKIALERLNEIHLREDEGSRNSNELIPQRTDINLKNMSFRYDDPFSKRILNNINLNIPYGKMTAIVGISGVGKTTLIKLLLGFYPPEEGEILIGETPLDMIDITQWRNRCGVVMQDGFIFSDTIANNICIKADSIDADRLLYATDVANITDYIMSLPLKYNTIIGEEGVGLSQGQKQRILIARAVYKNPDFIFFDEATNALDTKSEKTIVTNLAHFFIDKTVLVVAHRLSTIKNADQIVLLDDGQIAEVGTHNDLVAKKGLYYSLVQNQL